MTEPFRLPRLKTLDRIVDSLGRPTIQFIKFFNTDFARAIEAQEAAQAAQAAALAAVVSDLGDAVAAIAAAQAAADAAAATATAAQATAAATRVELDEVVSPQLLTVAESVQIAQSSANATQSEVDTLAATGAVSGSATNPAVDVADGTWVSGPQVDLTSVVAGDLTITGSGPQQDSDVVVTNGPFNGQFRIVEVVGGSDTELAIYSFTVGSDNVVRGAYPGAVASFLEARTSTGAVSYRIDARRALGTATVNSLSLYIYARRAA